MCLKSTKAFTLIEVLVVVAILALLVSILLPSLARAKETARIAVCKVNMQTIYKGHVYYGADNAQRFPDPDWWLWDGIGGEMRSWFPNLYSKSGGIRPTDSSRWVEFGHIYKYVKNKDCYFCPSDSRQRGPGGSIGSGQTYGGAFRGDRPIHSYVRLIHPHQFIASYNGADDWIANNPLPGLYRSDFINPDKLPKSLTYGGKLLDTRPARLGLIYEEFQNADDPATWAPSPPNLANMLNDGYSGFIVGDLGLNWQDYISVWHIRRSHVAFFDGHVDLVDAIKFNRKTNGSQYAQWVASGGRAPG